MSNACSDLHPARGGYAMKKSWFGIMLLPILAWAAQSPFDGTWKIHLENAPLLQVFGRPRIMLLQNGTYQCISCDPRYNIKADGTDQPIQGSKSLRTEAIKVVDNKTVEMKTKIGGKVSTLEKVTVSADGKMRTEDTIYQAGKEPGQVKVTYIRVASGPAGSHAISGTWRLQESIAPAAITCKSSPNGLMMSVLGESYDVKFDGKDYPVKGPDAARTVSLKRVNDRSIDLTIKRDGKIVSVNHMTVSADGKTLTVKVETTAENRTRSFTFTKQ
jgi:hypothetical protein